MRGSKDVKIKLELAPKDANSFSRKGSTETLNVTLLHSVNYLLQEKGALNINSSESALDVNNHLDYGTSLDKADLREISIVDLLKLREIVLNL